MYNFRFILMATAGVVYVQSELMYTCVSNNPLPCAWLSWTIEESNTNPLLSCVSLHQTCHICMLGSRCNVELHTICTKHRIASAGIGCPAQRHTIRVDAKTLRTPPPHLCITPRSEDDCWWSYIQSGLLYLAEYYSVRVYFARSCQISLTTQATEC